MKSRHHAVWMAAGACLLSACNLAPPYDAPKTATASGYKEAMPSPAAGAAAEPAAERGWKLADPKDSELGGHWWTLYGDPQLGELEERVAGANQTVLAADANYRAAHALVAEAEAALFPTLSLAPSVVRSRSSASVATIATAGSTAGGLGGTGTNGTGVTVTGTNGTGTTGTGVTGSGGAGTGATSGTGVATTGSTTPRTIYSVPLEASYQIDLWGSVRNTIAQDRFNAFASAAEVATAVLAAQSQLAQAYFELRVTDAQRKLLDTTLEDYRASLHLARTLSNNGLASDEDISEAEAQLAAAEAQATDLGVARAAYEHAIAVLVGVPPAIFSIPYQQLRQQLPAIPIGLPADLLERRPDIAAAERQVAATNAAIGIARAAYFPSLTLSASAGYEATSISKLFDWPNRFWSLGPELAQTLFDGGARRAATAQARALNEQAAANYRQTVLSALQSVEDNLAALNILAIERRQEHDAAVAAQRTVELSVVRYRNGVDSYVNVITAQNAFLTNRQAELQVQLRQLTASVALINDLGGGWNTADWDRTADSALHAPPQNQPGSDSLGAPNPPPLPAHEIRPEELLQQNRDAMSGAPH